MKIYLAGRFSRRQQLEKWGEQLQQLGHEIVSRWSLRNSDHKLVDGLSPQAADDERFRFAMEDCEDIRACDCVISLMEEPRSNGRGGRHVEFGYALALDKRLIIVGARETVFHHLDKVEHYETFQSLYSDLEHENWLSSFQLEDREDALRYRFLRTRPLCAMLRFDPFIYVNEHPYILRGDAADKVIDELMALDDESSNLLPNDALRYRWLRARPLGTVHTEGVCIVLPLLEDNAVLPLDGPASDNSVDLGRTTEYYVEQISYEKASDVISFTAASTEGTL